MSIQSIYRERCAEDSDIAAHLPYLHDTVVRLGAQTVVELGTRYGNSTSALLAAVESTGGHLWSVDPHPLVADARLLGSPQWTLITESDTDASVLAAIPDTIDVLFIDTTHRYGHTMLELGLYGERVRPGGVILCHDTEYVMDGTDGYPAEDGYPVARALDTWCEAKGIRWTNRPGSYGLGVVEIPERAVPECIGNCGGTCPLHEGVGA